jgi:hypothetical protein
MITVTRRTSALRSRLLPLLALLPLALAAQACSSYSYYDLDLKMGTGFSIATAGSVQFCHMFVTGAATDDFEVPPAACKTAGMRGFDIGTIEYSTFADAGNVTFTLKLFQYPESNPACELGEASTTLPAGKGTRTPGTINVPLMGTGCGTAP